MRYRLRTLLIVLAVAPPGIAVLWFAGLPAWLLLFLAVVTYFVVDESPVLVGVALRFAMCLFAVATAVKLISLAIS